jgi:RHS repeat-associated protein
VDGYAGTNYPFLTLKERDIETGLDYFGARYHSSAQGRFTSPDPLLSSGKSLQPQSWNRYSYCLNDPLNYVDPNGLIWGKKKTSDTNTEYVWFEGDTVGEGYDTVTEFYVEGMINGNMVGLTLNPNGPRSFWTQLALDLDPALSLMTNNSDYFVKGYEIGETRAQFAERSRTGAVDMMPNQAFDVGLFFAGGGLGRLNRAGAGAATETTTLYRAVTQPELDDIFATGTYRVAKGQSEGKYFFKAAEDAQDFGSRMFRTRPGEGPYTVTSAEVDRAVIEASSPVRAAGEGSAMFVPKSQLPIGPVKVGGSNPR